MGTESTGIPARPDTLAGRFQSALVVLGGGHRGDLPEAEDRSTFALAGALVALVGLLSWLITTAALTQATSWPWPVATVAALPFGVIVAAVSRAIATGAARRNGLAGRIGVALVVGLVIGELLSTVLFADAVDRRLADEAQTAAAQSPAVSRAQNELERAQADRAALDTAVADARAVRDDALVTARCEFNPSPECPPTRITGVPGQGPETLTANELLADAQAELNSALDNRDERAAQFDSVIKDRTAAVDAAHEASVEHSSGGLGNRWVAMNAYTFDNPGALVLRLILVAFATMLTLLPMLLRRWRGETTQDRHMAARAEQDRAVVAADTAIVVERELARVASTTEPDSAHVVTGTVIPAEPVRAIEAPRAGRTPALPERRSPDVLDSIESATRAATRLFSPFVPASVSRAIDSTATYPVRMARQVIEEVEEFTVTVRHTSRVTVHTDDVPQPDPVPIVIDEVVQAGVERIEEPAQQRPALDARASRRSLPR